MKNLSTTELVNEMLSYEHPDITNGKRLVLVAIANCYNSRSGQCNPTWKTIIRRLGCDRSTVNRAIDTANKIGILSWVKLSYLGNRPHNSYCWKGLCPNAKDAWTGPLTGESVAHYQIVGRSGSDKLRAERQQAIDNWPKILESLERSDRAAQDLDDVEITKRVYRFDDEDARAMRAWLRHLNLTGDEALLELEKALHYNPFMYQPKDEDGFEVEISPLSALVAEGISKNYKTLNYEWRVDSAHAGKYHKWIQSGKEGRPPPGYRPFTTQGD